jgi:hypothetical protein
LDTVQDEAGCHVAWNGGSAILAAANQEFSEPQIKSAFGGFAAVAVEAVGFENGANLPFEGDSRGGVDMFGRAISAADECTDSEYQQGGGTMQARE